MSKKKPKKGNRVRVDLIFRGGDSKKQFSKSLDQAQDIVDTNKNFGLIAFRVTERY